MQGVAAAGPASYLFRSAPRNPMASGLARDPMTPAEYHDWWCFSGICPGEPTRPANYAILREHLSTPGVSISILWRLLLHSAKRDETTYSPSTSIFGSDERIAEAARAVGAARLADSLAALPKPAVVPETHRELKKLLKQFAARHQAELAADVARHGDPRAAPGFDKRLAMRKLDKQWV